eukprot:Phypoly_transcript_09614.p1 GENE.Phypoly_transcript_09614~~Phypoly_transcript_09614.p1  ORF type:complete len:391 (+),score=47.41 Phypoly_transcript_09614:171-1343(+)
MTFFPWQDQHPSSPGTPSKPSDVPLFSPLTIRGATFKNRTVVSPMCTYSSQDGFANDWHLTHLTQFALGGASLIIAEATAVKPEGRISPYCTGLWKDEHIAGWRRVVDSIHSHGALAGIQLAHAGRKASTYPPFYPPEKQRTHVKPEEGGWDVVGVTNEKFSTGSATPTPLTTEQIKESVGWWGQAADRALKAGFDVIEIHAAHGYLLSTFLSPIVNNRPDIYGGSFENRIRYLREIVAEVRSVIPAEMPLFVRVSSADGVANGWNSSDTVKLAEILSKEGVDVVDCSSGGVVSSREAYSPIGHYQVPYAEAVHKAGVKSMAVGLITDPTKANEIIQNGQADLVALGRGFLHNPRWTYDAAQALGVIVQSTTQYSWTYKLKTWEFFTIKN